MQNKDWIKTGEDILRSVVDAVEQQDFSGLSKNIEDKVNDALGYVGDKINEGSKKYNVTREWLKAKQERERAEQARADQEYLNRERARQEAALSVQLYKKNPPGTYSGTALKVLGIVGTSLMGVTVFIMTILGFVFGSVFWILDVFFGGLFGGSIAMMISGNKIEKRLERFKRYVNQIGSKQYSEIKVLADAVGKKKSFVEKEIRQMIDKGFFLQGHVDHTGTTLITSNAMYEKYLAAEDSRKSREIEAAKRAEIEAKNSVYPERVQKILEEGKRYIQHIHECNDAIPGEVMSQKLATLEDIMTRIFEQLKKNPESCDDLQKLMKYYLPTTTKLIDAYREMDGQPSYGGNNIASTKKEIEDTLDIINEAFGKLFDDMFEDTAWDISADISTMKTMLAKEGLTGGSDFEL